MTTKIFDNREVDYDDFLREIQIVSIFQTRKFYDVVLKVKNYSPVFHFLEEDNDIKASVLAIFQKEYNNVLGFFTSRSIIIGGPVFAKENLKELDALLSEYNKKIRGKAIYTQFRNLRDFSKEEKDIFIKNGYKFEDHLDIVHDLTIPIEEQWLKVHKGRRKNIRRAEKQGVTFREIENLNEFDSSYQLVKSTYKRVKLPIPNKSLFYESYYSLTRENILKVFIAEYDKKIIATRMILCYNDLIYDWYAGADEKYLDKYPNDFLPWKVLEWGSNNGYEKFDFGGAGKPNIPYGVRDYKLKFGGELVNFGRFQQVHYPLIYRIMSLALNFYRKHLG